MKLTPEKDYGFLWLLLLIRHPPYLLSPSPFHQDSPPAGPPFRRIVDSGVPVGGGSGSTNVSPLNPWLSIYYMLTGKSVTRDLVNPGQTLTRNEALLLYTLGSAWFAIDEQKLGSIEVGKFADLVVLNQDYFVVPDEDVRRLRSVMAIVNGRVVYSDGAL